MQTDPDRKVAIIRRGAVQRLISSIKGKVKKNTSPTTGFFLTFQPDGRSVDGSELPLHGLGSMHSRVRLFGFSFPTVFIVQLRRRPSVLRPTSSTVEGRLAVYRSIDKFVKKNAPTPIEITPEWFSNHFNTAHFERESVEAATRELTRVLQGTLRDVRLDSLVFVRGLLYEIAVGVQFAELQISLSLNLTNIVPKQEPQGFAMIRGLGFLPGGAPSLAEQQLTLSALMRGQPLQNLLPNNPFHQRQSELYTRHVRVKAEATFSARIKEDQVAEVSLEKLTVDTRQLFSELYKSQTQEEP